MERGCGSLSSVVDRVYRVDLVCAEGFGMDCVTCLIVFWTWVKATAACASTSGLRVQLSVGSIRDRVAGEAGVTESNPTLRIST